MEIKRAELEERRIKREAEVEARTAEERRREREAAQAMERYASCFAENAVRERRTPTIFRDRRDIVRNV